MATKKTTKKNAQMKRHNSGSGRATASAKKKKPRKSPTTKSPVKAKGTNLLDAASTILANATNPMSCREMIEVILKRRLWSTQGKTPAATLSSAILREIKSKGKQSRFMKAERGRFRLVETA